MRRKGFLLFFYITIVAGGTVFVTSALSVPLSTIDIRFLFLALITITIGSRITVEIPRVGGHISVSDTFIFLSMLLFGGEAAILLSAVEALCSSVRIGNKWITTAFNAATAACSAFVTVWTLRLCFGSVVDLRGGYSAPFIIGICLMALVQYISNSGMVATAVALKNNQPLWPTWRKHFLWTSLTYFAGASAAGIISKLIDSVGFYAFLATTPIIAIVYFTYTTYLKNIEASIAQAEQAKRLQEQFSQVEKMSALGQLASGVAHDFNNCLASILARAELSLKYVDEPVMKRNLEIIIRSAADGAKTVKRIQDFARQRSVQDFELVDVDQLLLDVSEITRPRWKDSAVSQNVHISLDLQLRSGAFVMGDDSELKDVLVNMVFNAVDAMPQGGQLTLASALNNASVIISVIDTGIGMNAEVRSRVFEPFFTTKGVAGMGLGLAVGYGVIRRHEGIIDVYSQVGSGTKFDIKLPLAEYKKGVEVKPNKKRVLVFNTEIARANWREGPAAMFEAGNAYTNGGSDNKRSKENSFTFPEAKLLSPSPIRVLIIDDDPMVLTSFGDLLNDTGYIVSTASSGLQALEIAKDFCPDILLADYNMPGMNGIQTLQALKSIVPEALAIMITGYSDINIITEALRQFVFDFLVKPVSIVDLNQSIQRAVIYRDSRERERRQKDFLSIVSHELRAPLQAPLRYLENILSGDPGSLNEKQRTILQRAAKGIKTEVRLVNNLLDLQYLESGRFNIRPLRYSLRSTIQEVVDSFFLQITDSKVNLIWNPPHDPFLLSIDSEQIKQAISNILNNALEHTPRDKVVEVRLFRSGDKLKCTIRDEGAGIPPPYSERIFQKSFQVPSKNVKKGLGIGLYIAREIVRAHGGEIMVKSKLGKGSIFIIALPDNSQR
jgi:signal transduction histidine kinase